MTASSVSDLPEAYLAEDRQRAIAAGTIMPEHVEGAALFADISGFTALTEALAAELGPQRGAERLSDTLESVFGQVLSVLHEHGGSVIYFSGDAITCWLDRDDGTVAVACALAMQQVIAKIALISLPSGRVTEIGMKVTVAVGSARRFVVGDPQIQLIDVLAGSLVDRLVAAEPHTRAGEVVLEDALVSALARSVQSGDVRHEPVTGRRFVVVTAMTAQPRRIPRPMEPVALPVDAVRPWLLPAVYERLRAGRGEFLAELRFAVPLFLRFGGIDYDADPQARHKLDDFVVRAQRIIDGYGGNALQLTIGDKGAYLYAVFGSPIAHEDDAARACAAALELVELDRHTAVTDIQIGVAHGRLRSGTYGHPQRRTFCCLGDAVNLAARVMSAAPPGAIYVSEVVHDATRERYTWTHLPDMRVKGRSEPVGVRALLGRRSREQRVDRSVSTRPMMGRSRELTMLSERIGLAGAGHGQIVGISAHAGMGKSRLLGAARDLPAGAGFRWLHGAAPAFGVTASYLAWRDVWQSAFGLSEQGSPAERAAAAGQALGALGADLAPRLPLLGPVLGIDVPDNDVTRSFDAKLRKTSTEQLLAQCLERLAEQGPVVVVLEDCNWLDPLSVDLLDVLARSAERLPVLMLFAYRPPAGTERLDWRERLATMGNFTEIVLGELAEDDARSMLGDRYRRLFGTTADPPTPLVDLVMDRCEGNPFHIEELLAFVRVQDVDPDDAPALGRLDVPDSLNSLVLSRIDVLAEEPRRTVKVASVIGRDFHVPMVHGTYPPLGTVEQIAKNLVDLQSTDLVEAAHDLDDSFLFRHAVIRDVAYDSMPFALRETLHENAGAYLESDDDVTGHRQLDLLAHHYSRSANVDKKREYLLRAGDAAQSSYANSAAIDYFERAITLVDDSERVAVLLKLGKVVELVGEWTRADECYDEALRLADALGDRAMHARTRTAQAEVARKQGQYDLAAQALDEAEQVFVELGDQAGVGQVLHIGGTLAAQRGQYDEARRKYSTSLQIREELGDTANVASLLSNLAIVAEYEDDLPAARELSQRALALRRQTGDQWAIGISQNNLGLIVMLQGDLEAARACFSESMQLHRAVGDLWMVAMGHNNLGNAMRLMGELDGAGPHFAESLRGYRRFDERWAIAILYEDIALYAVDVGEPTIAFQLDGAARQLRESLGSPRSPSQQATVDASLDPVRAVLPDEGRGWTEQGRSLSANDADAVALSVCLR